ncbi:MAG TPA: hypothetical protein VFK66_10675 [Oryzihumus sp.]|nr:hypothetical protein [Oryzihumus sp.]
MAPPRSPKNPARTGAQLIAEDQVSSQGEATTKLQEAAYNSQLAAALPNSELAHILHIQPDGLVDLRQCGAYIHAIQHMDWFTAAFTAHAAPVIVVGGRGSSHADAAQRRVKIGTNDRRSSRQCEHACLHELAHIVTPDYGPGRELREPVQGRGSSRGHHHAWRVNFVLIVRMTLGRKSALRLRHEFNQWGLPTR